MIVKTFTVDWGDGKVSATTNGWTVIQWERKTKQKLGALMNTGLGGEDLYMLAWIALKDAGITVPAFDEFARKVTDFFVEDEPASPT